MSFKHLKAWRLTFKLWVWMDKDIEPNIKFHQALPGDIKSLSTTTQVTLLASYLENTAQTVTAKIDLDALSHRSRRLAYKFTGFYLSASW
ncbi:hypothetical protein HYPSUDRAFT_597544 [Hypholoma sublateritium FD-334 SS-4]|uniref:Uncharacterized protein n=1 Tax=Hypholoma sublateritium (strain FD-334 SS-4) TaxID=945553 RepID=A0A0D2L7Y4_HYPSF|nr:hypothetical protein HYPSUDRAFT_597544 [Hypholoma sublateritium FD-334 SS-4]